MPVWVEGPRFTCYHLFVPFFKPIALALLVALCALLGAESFASAHHGAGAGDLTVGLSAPAGQPQLKAASPADRDVHHPAPCDLCQSHFGHTVGLVHSWAPVLRLREASAEYFVRPSLERGLAPGQLMRPPRLIPVAC